MTLEETIVARLREKNLTIALAESCTGGWVAKRLTDVPGASAVFECGIVCYSNRIKHELLGVRAETLRAFGAVSEETAREMAAGVRAVSGADLAVSVTGIAGPSSDDTCKPVGLVYIALTDGKTTLVQAHHNPETDNVREHNRRLSTEQALDLIWRYLEL